MNITGQWGPWKLCLLAYASRDFCVFRKRVLFMGDSAILSLKNKTLLHTIKMSLTQMGFVQIIENDDPEKLLRQIHNVKNTLIIFDPSEYGTNGIRVAKVLAREKMGPVVFILSNMRLLKPIEEIIEKESQAATYITTPINFDVLRVAVRTTLISHRKITELENRLIDINEMLAEKKKINKAKELLIKNRNLDEAQAHKMIQKISMNTGKSMRVVAEKIIREFSYPNI